MRDNSLVKQQELLALVYQNAFVPIVKEMGKFCMSNLKIYSSVSLETGFYNWVTHFGKGSGKLLAL